MNREEAIIRLEQIFDLMNIPKNQMALQMAIDDMREQEERRWIPVTRRLPKNYIPVLVYISSAKPLPMVHEAYIGSDGEWHSPAVYGLQNENVTHWMPLPEPPEET